jgi:hypothetical protein
MNELKSFTRLLALAILLASALTLPAATVYSTGFESGDGFTLGSPLAGSGGWVGLVSGHGLTNAAGAPGNGITNNAFTGLGQSGFVGGPKAMTNLYDTLLTWPPLTPIPTAATSVVFSTAMKVLPSSSVSEAYSWNVFNSQSNLLFNLYFNDDTGEFKYYLSSDNTTHSTGIIFDQNFTYNLVVTMNPASNTWNATLNGATWVSPQLMAPNTNRSVACIAAGWNLNHTNNPGNGYMAFDNYQIVNNTGAATPPPRPTLAVRSAAPGAPTVLRLTGTNSYKFAIDASTNLTGGNWTALVTNTVTTNSFDYSDAGAATLPWRHYRARWVP